MSVCLKNGATSSFFFKVTFETDVQFFVVRRLSATESLRAWESFTYYGLLAAKFEGLGFRVQGFRV